MKNYETVELLPGTTIEEAVIQLRSYDLQGKLVSATFNGVTLYSDTVTLDDAYQQIIGLTKEQYEKL